jgi:hypothetical protein
MYVDESGDPGLSGSPSPIFVLSGVVLNEQHWLETRNTVIAFRQRMRSAFGLKMREEIHAAKFITSPGELVRIRRNDRLAILRHFTSELAMLPYLSVINVVVNKTTKPDSYDVYERAWQALIQRFENTLGYGNFPGPCAPAERGMVFADGQPSSQLTKMFRKMRAYNPVPNQVGGGYRNLTMSRVLEDPVFRDSAHSIFIQAADLAAFLLYQYERPNAYMRKSGAHSYFNRLAPILCRHASPRDPHGIVRL